MGHKRKPLNWIREGECIRCTSHYGNRDGYPIIRGRHISRWILMHRMGEIPKGIVARHTCDNAWCIRPDHIIHGTPADNMHDRKARGRYGDQRGEKNPYCKLTSTQVSQIREASGLQREIAERFGVTQSHVSLIRGNKSRRDA